MKKLITFAFVLCVFSKTPVAATVLFEDNFDSQPDWQSNQGADNIVSYSHNCSTNCPPTGWAAYRANRTLFTTDTKDTYVIDTEGSSTVDGKGLTYNVECTGGYPDWTSDNYSSTWVGGGLNIYLGNNTNYDELYVQHKIKFGDGWRWNDPDHLFKHVEWKMLSIDSYKCTIPGTCTNFQGQTCDPVARFPSSGGCVVPATAVEQYHNASTVGQSTTAPIVRPMIAIRRAPTYDANFGPLNWTDTLPTDNNWHTYEYRVKMNSAPGVADGCITLWVDGVEIEENCSIEWEMSATSSDYQEIGWNLISLFDNITISAYPISAEQHQQIYMDDVIISTTYIGTSYVIGTHTAKHSTGTGKHASGTGKFVQ